MATRAALFGCLPDPSVSGIFRMIYRSKNSQTAPEGVPLQFSIFRLGLVARVLALLALVGTPTASLRAQTEEILTNDLVKQMVAAKVNKDIIIDKINSTKPGFDVSSNGIAMLVEAKVDQKYIQQILKIAENAAPGSTAASTLIGLDEVLANGDIIRMVSSKVPNSLITQKIRISAQQFDISAQGLVALQMAKVPQDVQKAMMSAPLSPHRVTSPPGGTPANVDPPKGKRADVPPTPVSPKKTVSIAIYPFAAGGLTRASKYQTESGAIHTGLPLRLAQGFEIAGGWAVNDRTSEEKIAAEMERSRSATNFRSSVILADGKKMNAQFILTGNITSATVTSTKDAKTGCQKFKATINFGAQMADVQTGTMKSTRTFIATWPSTNAASVAEVGARKGINRLLNGKCAETAEGAVEDALIDAKNLIAAWAKTVLATVPAK